MLQSLFNLDAISDENILKKNAENYYYSNNYLKTIFSLQKLSKDNDNIYSINLNLAHSYFNLKQYTNAYRIYKKSLQSSDKIVQSIALMQIGLIHAITAQEMQTNSLLKKNANNHYLKSLKYIKQSILANPENDIARLNYEILANNVSLNNLKLESLIYKPKEKSNKTKSKKDDSQKGKQKNDEINEQNTLGKSEIKSEKETENKGLSAQNSSQDSKENKQTNTQESAQGMNAKLTDDSGHLQGGIDQNKGLASDKGKHHGKIDIEKKTDTDEKPQMNKNKLKSLRISEEAALKILDEMQQNEKQFLQHYYLKPDVKGKPNYKQKW